MRITDETMRKSTIGKKGKMAEIYTGEYIFRRTLKCFRCSTRMYRVSIKRYRLSYSALISRKFASVYRTVKFFSCNIFSLCFNITTNPFSYCVRYIHPPLRSSNPQFSNSVYKQAAEAKKKKKRMFSDAEH